MKHFCSLALGGFDPRKETKEYRLDINERAYKTLCTDKQGNWCCNCGAKDHKGAYGDGISIEQEDDGPLRMIIINDDSCFSQEIEIDYCPMCGYRYNG
jgi:hypothetical protein